MDYKNASMDEIIKRINELYNKMKAEGLSEEEKEEQAELRSIYKESIVGNFKAQLQGVKPNNPVKKK